jgi:hypothetical protein
MSYYPRVSYASLVRWERCQELWRAHADGRYKKTDPTVYLVGNVMDSLVAGMVASRLFFPVEVELARALGDFDRRVAEHPPRWMGDRTTESERDRVAGGVGVLWELLRELGIERSSERWTAKLDVRVPMRGWMLDGELDLLIQRTELGPTEVWDVKTGSSHHADQLVFYDILMEQWGLPITKAGFIEPFGRGLVEVMVTDADRLSLKERIAACVRGVAGLQAREAEFTGYPDQCGWCDAKTFCARWDKARSGKLKES